jgi:hypothetical protein
MRASVIGRVADTGDWRHSFLFGNRRGMEQLEKQAALKGDMK